MESSRSPSKFARLNFLITDIGFIVYWSASAFSLFPTEWLYKDSDNPILMAWNWSFAPLDLLASVLGLYAVTISRADTNGWRNYALVSLVLTQCAGLMAISFWAIRGDFDPWWWAPNLYLILWPLLCYREVWR